LLSIPRLNSTEGRHIITRIITVTVAGLFVAPFAFGQMKYSRGRAPSPTPAATQSPTPAERTLPAATQSPAPAQRTLAAPTQSRPTATPAPTQAKPTPTPVPPPDVKAYLDRQVANSKDKKFHFTVNGKDLALTPFHVWEQKSTGSNTTSTSIDMRSDDGRIYDIDFVTTGPQVTGIKIHRINGESLR
jgi:hypothetical protein